MDISINLRTGSDLCRFLYFAFSFCTSVNTKSSGISRKQLYNVYQITIKPTANKESFGEENTSKQVIVG